MDKQEVAKALIRMAKDLMAESGGKEEYQKFFQKKLDKYKVKSPSQLDDAQKKKFFQEIEDEWKSDDETKKASRRVRLTARKRMGARRKLRYKTED